MPLSESSARPLSGEAGLATFPRLLLAIGTAFLACLVAQLVSFHTIDLLLVWPGAAVAFAFAWRYGLAWSLPAAAGAALWAWIEFGDAGVTLSAFAASAFGPALGAFALRRLHEWKPADYRLETAVRFVALVVLVAAPIDALLASTGMRINAGIGEMHFAHRFLVWWLIDSLGLLLIAPALLAWFGHALAATDGQPDQDEPLLDAPAFFLTTLVVAASLGVSLLGYGTYAYALLFLYFPIVVWIAIRMNERAMALSLVVTTIPLLIVRSHQIALAADPFGRAVEASMLVFTAIVVALMLQAVASDRRFALARVGAQAREDMSTGLLNDRGLIAEVGERLAMPTRPDYGLIGLHLANFDTLNDLCGTIPALQLEQNAAALLLRQPGAQAAARLSGGRFALLVEADSVAQVRAVAREVYSQLNGQLFKTENGSLRLQTCVGGLLVDRHALINSEDCLMSLSDAMAIA
ncbi:MAG TPA: MASE1 domain-containing protein, partial [Zeimonas sp.]